MTKLNKSSISNLINLKNNDNADLERIIFPVWFRSHKSMDFMEMDLDQKQNVVHNENKYNLLS